MSQIAVRQGDSREVLREYADASLDACVTDPPYALVSITKRWSGDGPPTTSTGAYANYSGGFMGQKWDVGDTAHDPDFWREVYRALKPGAHVVAFAGTRTYHRLACAIEDAGFEIRDMVAWLYGSGFPKSHNVAVAIDKQAGVPARSKAFNMKGRGPRAEELDANGREWLSPYEATTDEAVAWAGWGTALKPALEPIVLARKPLAGTVAANVLAHGTGALNIDACRVETDGGSPSAQRRQSAKFGSPGNDRRREDGGRMGRRESLAAYQAERPGEQLGRWPANVTHDGSGEVVEGFPETTSGVPVAGDRNGGVYGQFAERSLTNHGPSTGSAARFFYTAKADAEDRLGSKHPTVKPVSLMRWLVRLVTPPGGKIIDPFAGTGTTGLAALAEGFDAILVEREPTYVADIERRLAWARGEGRLTAQEAARDRPEPPHDPDSLFTRLTSTPAES